LDLNLHATVTRIRRGDVEFPASPTSLLYGGDVVRVVTHPDNVARLAKYFGDSLEDIAHTDFLSIALGLVLGVLVGMLPLPLGAPPHPALGVAGGTLFVALVLGKIGRTGGIIWTLSREANLALRQFGLLLFLATVGLKTGGQFKSALAADGLRLMLAGALITASCSFSLTFFMRRVMKENLMTTLGVLAGAHTQPACLAYGENLIGDQAPEFREGLNVGYAAVFPVAMVLKIVLATTLLKILGL
jgi:putative transport protein